MTSSPLDQDAAGESPRQQSRTALWTFRAPAIARAQHLHGVYVRRLDRMLSWLGEDDNAGRVALLDLLRSIIRAHEQMEEEGEAHEHAASSSELWEAITTPTRTAYETRELIDRGDVERAARDLIDWLESSSFRTQFERLPVIQRLQLLADLGEGLSQSTAGLRYLTHHATAPLDERDDAGHEPAPAFHLSRLEDYEGDFLGDLSAAAAAAAGTYAAVANTLIPGLMARVHLGLETEVVVQYVRVIRVFYRLEVLEAEGYLQFLEVLEWEEIVTLEQLERTVIDITDFNRKRPEWLRRLGVAATGLQALVSTGAAVVSFQRLVHDDSLRNHIGFQLSVARAVDHADAALRAAHQRAGRDIAASYGLRVVSGLTTGVDVAVSAWDATAAFREGDWKRGSGNVMQGISGIAMTVGMKKLYVGGALSWNPWGWGLVAGGLALTLGGAALTLSGSSPPPHPLVARFEHTVFGTRWEDVPRRVTGSVLEDLLNDEAYYYRWKRPDGSVDTDRQLWMLRSFMQPVGLERAELEERLDGLERVLHVRIRPAMGTPGSYIVLRVFDLGEEKFFVLPLAPAPIGEIDGVEHLLPTPPGYLDGQEQVVAWEATLDAADVWGHASFLEVMITPPVRLHSRFIGFFPELPGPVRRELTMAVLERRALTQVGG